MTNAAYYNDQNQGINDWGNYTSAAQLPNVSGATVQNGQVSLYDRCTLNGLPMICTTTTLSGAVWAAIVPRDAFGLDVIQTVNAASATIAGGTTRVLVTYVNGTCTLTLPTVAAGAPIGTKIVIHKANTSASAISVTPDSGSSINAGTTDAAQTMVGLNSTASTTASSASTNDIAAIFVRTGATTWRSTAA